jgi:hypothetical protein
MKDSFYKKKFNEENFFFFAKSPRVVFIILDLYYVKNIHPRFRASFQTLDKRQKQIACISMEITQL